MYNSPRVSIIIPVYNGEQFISDSIHSVLLQSYTNFELIIINDGSNDKSADVIKNYTSNKQVIYIEQQNAGVAAARNTALRHATGEYIGFLDQDDMWLPDKLERQVAYLRSHPEVGLVHSRQEYIDDSGHIIEYPDDWVEPVSGHCFKKLFIRNYIATLTVLIRREVLDKVGLFKENLSRVDDYELWLRIAMNYQLGFQDEVLARYRIHASNASHDRLKMRLLALEAQQSILDEFPRARELLGPKIIRDVFHAHYQALGRTYLWPRCDYAAARKYLFKAAALRPTDHLTMKLLLKTFTAPKLAQIQWYMHRLRHLVGGEADH